MRPHNSVGGFRIYPTSPQVAEHAERGFALIAQFNEGMDRLNRERELDQTQQNLVNNLHPNSQLARSYQALSSVSNGLWQQALELQNLEITVGHVINELGLHLNACANRWQEFKRQLDEHA